MAEVVDIRRADLFGDSEMAQRIRGFDWEATPLGPIASWPPRLMTAVQAMLASRFQFALFWGPELTYLYNDALIPTLADWHPKALGMSTETVLAEMWDVVGPQLRSVIAGGEATLDVDAPLLFDRNGQPEELYFTYSYSPIRDEFGHVVGVLLATEETTRRVIAEHHLRILQLIAVEAASARTGEVLSITAAEALGTNPGVVFSRVYLFEGSKLRLAAASGLDLPGTVDGEAAFEPALEDLASGSSARIVGLGRDRADGLPAFAVAIPIADSGQRLSEGVLFVGFADTRPIDESQLRFMELAAQQIGSALTARRALALAAANAEREHIERDLHDGAQQRLISIQIKVGLLRDRVAEPELDSEFDEIIQDADAAIDDLRNLARSVYPAVLRDHGLGDGLRELATNAPIRIDVLDTGVGRYPPAVEAAVYFCALEAIQNAVKHVGREGKVTIMLDRKDDKLRFVVADDGPGFDPARRSDGRGLANMHGRLITVGGRLKIDSAPGRGTSVEGTIPVHPAPAD